MEKNFIKISEYAERMSLHIRTAYRYFHSGKIEGFQDEETKTIFIKNPFSEKNLSKNSNEKRAVLYARVLSSENRANLEAQMERLKNYANAKGYKITNEVKEIGSGLNDNRKKLSSILENRENYDFIIVEHKDRLTRFGFNYLEAFMKSHKKEIEVINDVSNNKEDLMQDFISIIASFCARIYGQRKSRRKTEKIIKELEKSKE
jgi:resolvase domain protein